MPLQTHFRGCTIEAKPAHMTDGEGRAVEGRVLVITDPDTGHQFLYALENEHATILSDQLRPSGIVLPPPGGGRPPVLREVPHQNGQMQ